MSGCSSQSLGPISHRWGYRLVKAGLPQPPVPSMFTRHALARTASFTLKALPLAPGNDLGRLTDAPQNNTGSWTEEVIPFPGLILVE